MIDLGLTKIAVIGVIALIVVGPERLPKVARTIGTLLGRAQRYVNDVKAEVSREMDLDELRKMKDTVRDAAQSFEHSIHNELHQTGDELNATFNGATGSVDGDGVTSAPSRYLKPAQRKNWRVRRAATPVWFRQANRTRTRVQSAAARVARHRVKL